MSREANIGPRVIKDGKPGHMVTYSEYQKFVPEDYHTSHKKKTK
jgi:hypothetical protein